MGRSKKGKGAQPPEGADGSGDLGSKGGLSEEFNADAPVLERAEAEEASPEITSSEEVKPAKATRKTKSASRRSRTKHAPEPTVVETRGTDSTWKLTDDLIKTLNQELGGLKEYVLADLRGEITALRSQKLQLQTEINQLQSDRNQHLSQSEVSENLLQEISAIKEQVAALKKALEVATQTTQQTLESHEQDLNERLNRMQMLEHQGEVLLGALVQRLQQLDSQPLPTPDMSSDMSPIASVLGKTSTRGIAASLRSRTEEQPPISPMPKISQPSVSPPAPSLEQQEASPSEASPALGLDAFPASQVGGARGSIDGKPTTSRGTTAEGRTTEDFYSIGAQTTNIQNTEQPSPEPATRAAALSAEETLTLSEFPADALFGRTPPPAPSSPPTAAPTPPPTSKQNPFEPKAHIDEPAVDGVEAPPWTEQEPSDFEVEGNPAAEEYGAEYQPETYRSGEYQSEEYQPEEYPSEPYQQEPYQPDETGNEALGLANAQGQSLRLWPKDLSNISVTGWVSAGLSLFLMALQYCTLHLIFQGASGWDPPLQALIPATWSSALLTFWIRMLMVLPFMIVIGQGIYPPLLEEMQEVFRSRDRRPLISIVISSFFFFLSQFLLYYAIGTSSAAVAVGLLFLYPLGVNFLGMGLLKRPLGRSQLLACLPLGLGGLILLAQAGSSINPAFWAALCFSFYVLLGRAYTRRIHVLTLTVMQFGCAWLFSMPALFFLREMRPSHDVGYVVACLVLSLTVFLSYFFNTASLNRLGAGLSRLINGWTPLLVALLSIVFSLHLPTLAQGLGLLLVTLGLTALNLERLDA